MEESTPGVRELLEKRWARISPSELSHLCLAGRRSQSHPSPLPGYLEWSSQHVCFQDGKLQVHDGILMGQDSGFSWPIGTIRVGTVKPSHSQRREWGSRWLCKPIQEGRQKILYFYLFFNLIFFSFLEGVFFIKNMICFWDNNNVLLLFSHSVLSDSLQPRGLQHARQPSDMMTMQPVEKRTNGFKPLIMVTVTLVKLNPYSWWERLWFLFSSLVITISDFSPLAKAKIWAGFVCSVQSLITGASRLERLIFRIFQVGHGPDPGTKQGLLARKEEKSVWREEGRADCTQLHWLIRGQPWAGWRLEAGGLRTAGVGTASKHIFKKVCLWESPRVTASLVLSLESSVTEYKAPPIFSLHSLIHSLFLEQSSWSSSLMVSLFCSKTFPLKKKIRRKILLVTVGHPKMRLWIT